MASGRSPIENVLWIAGAALTGLGAIGGVKIIIICGVVLMICVFGYKTIVKNMQNKEESEEWEYASYHEGSKSGYEEAHAEPALLVQPLSGAEASGEASEDGQHEGLGHYRDVSGDGCGDGGYCGGHWVKKSGHGHRRGEPIGGDPWEPFNAFCATFWWTNPVVAGGCSVGASAEFYSKVH